MPENFSDFNNLETRPDPKTMHPEEKQREMKKLLTHVLNCYIRMGKIVGRKVRNFDVDPCGNGQNLIVEAKNMKVPSFPGSGLDRGPYV